MKNKIISLILALLMAASGASMFACEKDEGAETNPPGTTAVETTAPATDAPETQAPETEAPETEAPATEAPATEAPETEAPATEAPETKAPETEAPTLTAPETPYPIDKLMINGADISEYVIAYNAELGGMTYFAAEQLQKYIELSTGVTLSIESAGVPAGTKRILIDPTIVEDDDSTFRYFTDADGLVIAGGVTRGSMYAVYHFLEKALNWRFFTSDTEVCYETNVINLVDVDYTYVHQYKIRDLYMYDYFDSMISLKRYQNGDGKRRMGDYGGVISYCPLGIHNFGTLSKTGGGSDPNPCLNHAGNRKRILMAVKEYLAENPDTKSIQISQNDKEEYCMCDACKKDLELYKTPAGSIVELMNYIAEKIHEDYPDVIIITFAYMYSFECPENIVCHDNVMIELTPINMCYQHALTDTVCDVSTSEFNYRMMNNQDIMEQIEKWSKICKHFYLYDYSANFRYYYSPFPMIDNLYDNYQVFNEIGAWGYINLGNAQNASSEFGELRAYLYAKLTEEPGMTREEFNNHVNEFLAAYYGPAWTIVKEYFDFLHKLSDDNGKCFCVYSSPEEIYGDHAFAPYNDQLIAWFDQAETMVENETQLLHLERLRFSMDYLRIGAIHQDIMNSGDQEKIDALIYECKLLYNRAHKLGLDWATESFKLTGIRDFSVNPRTWIAIHNYEE